MKDKDLANGLFFEKWPDWLRWLLFLPSALIVPFLIQGVGRMTAANYLGFEPNSFILELYADLVMGSGVVLIGALVAPKHQFVIAVLLLVVMSILVASPFLTPGAVEYWGTSSLVHVLFSIGAGIAVVYQLHEHSKKT